MLRDTELAAWPQNLDLTQNRKSSLRGTAIFFELLTIFFTFVVEFRNLFCV